VTESWVSIWPSWQEFLPAIRQVSHQIARMALLKAEMCGAGTICSMNLGFYVSRIDRAKGHERNVPAHIQLPLHMLGMLAERGHEAHLITNPPQPNSVMPYCLPENIRIHTVVDSRYRGGESGSRRYPSKPTDSHLLKSLRQLMQIRRIAREQKLHVLHFHGYEWAIYSAGLLKRTGLPCPVVVTHYGPPDPPGFLARQLCKTIDAAITATQYSADNWYSLGPRPHVIRHGSARDLLIELDEEGAGPRHRVLYWRDPSHRNGVDICMDVFDALAPIYPHISFDFAVRPNPNEVPGLDDLAARHENIHVYRLPYPPGMSIPRLIAESICVFLPFRSLTTNPQLAIAESLAAGVAVVTTTVESNPEIIEDGKTGILIPPDDVDAASQAVSRLLDHPEDAAQIGRNAAASAKEMWNWDRCIDELIEFYREVCGNAGFSTR
jgi:glycosyltransferase involved in cell wall biosynthesis